MYHIVSKLRKRSSVASRLTRVKLRAITPVLAAALLLVGVVGAPIVVMTASAYADSVSVVGSIKTRGGSFVKNVSVVATNSSGTKIEYGPSYSQSNGSYKLDVSSGTYTLHFTPPSGSGLAALVKSHDTIVTGQTINASLATASPDGSSTCSMMAGQQCTLENQVGLYLYGTTHGLTVGARGADNGGGDGYVWVNVNDGVWGEIISYYSGLCWNTDPNSDPTEIVLDSCNGDQYERFWLQSAGGHYAIKNYWEGTGPAVESAGNGFPALFSPNYNSYSEWDMH